MRADLLISGSWTRMVLASFDALGLDARRLCAAAGVSYAQLSDSDARVPRDLSGRLWREAARASEDPFIGLHAGERIVPAANNLLSHIVISSATFLEGLERTLPYQRVLAHGRVMSLQRRRDHLAIVFRRVDGDLPITRSELEFMTAAFVRFGRTIVPRVWRVETARFDFDSPGSAGEYERALGCRVEFGRSENSLIVPAEVMTTPLPHHCPAVVDALTVAADAAIERILRPSVSGDVRSRILARMRARRADTTVETIAMEMHVSPRTLQRRLESEQSSFSFVLEQAQRDRCLELLEGSATLEEIGTAVGLSGSRALARAFKRWTGRTPSEHRRLARGATSA
jgi:AraC-like DNA-binding protein